MTLGLGDVEMGAWRAFLRSHSRLMRRLDQELSDEESLRLSQFEVLLWLGYGPRSGTMMSELADKVLLSPSGVTRAVEQLERRGFVERRRGDADGRVFFAVLTPAGRSMLRRAKRVHVRGIREHFLSFMSPDQLEVLKELLDRVAPQQQQQSQVTDTSDPDPRATPKSRAARTRHLSSSAGKKKARA